MEIGDKVRIYRPNVKIKVSNNKHNSVGIITKVNNKDKTAKVKTIDTKLNINNWESFSWLKPY